MYFFLLLENDGNFEKYIYLKTKNPPRPRLQRDVLAGRQWRVPSSYFIQNYFDKRKSGFPESDLFLDV